MGYKYILFLRSYSLQILAESSLFNFEDMALLCKKNVPLPTRVFEHGSPGHKHNR